MGQALRYRLSGITSLALAVVLAFLPYVPEQYFWLNFLAVIVFLTDGTVKFLDMEQFRPYTSAAYSFTLAVLFLTYFKLFGTPLSEVFALLLVLDGILKLVPGNQMIGGISESVYRHVLSAIVTLLIGLGIFFSVSLPFALNYILGLIVLADAMIKLEFANIL